MSKTEKSSSPHIKTQNTTRGIMSDVIIALCPAALYGCILFGLKAILVLVTTTVTAVAAEALWNLALRKKQTVGDLSAIVTGMLLGMCLSSQTPLWVAAIGSTVAIIVVKQMFGGLGHNLANPAASAHVVLIALFSSRMSQYVSPIDAASTATPLSDNAELGFKQLFFGMHSGAIGETASFLLIIGGVYLMLRRVIKPIIPLTFIGTVALLSLIGGQNLQVSLFSGGLILGSIFMATDHSTSPASNLGMAIFGVGCGLITFIIRQFSDLPEGVSYAILVMNILTPLINCIPPLTALRDRVLTKSTSLFS